MLYSQTAAHKIISL